MITTVNVLSLIEEADLCALQRGFGLLCEAINAGVDDASLAAAARYYVSAHVRWEESKEWRAAVKA